MAMTDNLLPLLSNSLAYLKAINRERLRPAEAKVRLCSLRRQHPDTGMDLVWEEQAYDQSVHYDLLLRPNGGETISLSFCPDRALPWPLRGVQRWTDTTLVRVNNTTLTVDKAIACLDFMWDEARIVDHLVNLCLIEEALQREPVALSDSELQQALDAFRSEHRLGTVEETGRWMERHGMSHQMLEELVAGEAIVAKLRDRITAGAVEEYFARHRADFDTAWISRLILADEKSAWRMAAQLRAGEVDFDEAARRLFLTARESPAQPSRTLFAVVRRREVPDELAAIFSAAAGEVLGPVRANCYTIVRVLANAPACLDEPTRAAIKKLLFDQWLEERRSQARIEWNWGNAARTTAGSDGQARQ
jgi:putative peptide maturation system protein